MSEADLWEVEEAFADRYVRSFHFGELVKGHRIVLAELGLASYEGKQVRDPDLFNGLWSKQRRADHILHRLAFVRELFERSGHSTLVLYRGSSYREQPHCVQEQPHIRDFQFRGRDEPLQRARSDHDRVLHRQSVPVERLFMSFLETVQMNRPYKEAEAVLIHDSANLI